MELFWKSVAACLLAAVMGLTIEKQEKALAMLLGSLSLSKGGP